MKGGQELMNALDPHYYAFVDLVDFHELALATMREVEVPEMRMEVNPDVTEMFLDLYVVLLQCILLCTQLEERKLLLVFHALLHQSLKGGAKEASNEKVMHFMKEYGSGGENTLKKLWAVMQPFGQRVVSALLGMQMTWMKVRSVTTLRNDGVLNLYANPAKLSLPSSQPIYDDLMRASRMNNWFYFGCLFSPEEIATNEAAQSLLKFVISDTFVAPLYRDYYLNLNKEWDEASSYKTKTVSMSKAKKSFKEGFTDQTANCAQAHRDRRTFIRQELTLLKSFVTDTPALIAPKFPLLLASLSWRPAGRLRRPVEVERFLLDLHQSWVVERLVMLQQHLRHWLQQLQP